MVPLVQRVVHESLVPMFNGGLESLILSTRVGQDKLSPESVAVVQESLKIEPMPDTGWAQCELVKPSHRLSIGS